MSSVTSSSGNSEDKEYLSNLQNKADQQDKLRKSYESTADAEKKQTDEKVVFRDDLEFLNNLKP